MFIESIRSGTPVLVDGNDAYQAELIALSAKLSNQIGKPVKIEDAIKLAAEVLI